MGSDLPGTRIKVSCFVDGFNLYHALHDLKRPELKWLNLRKLLSNFIDPSRQDLAEIYYFSAYAEWLEGPCERHKQYVVALKSEGVTPVMGHFKEKTRRCPSCKHIWTGHEEKETDVNIALWMLKEAYKGSFDEAFLISRDSDLAPAVRSVVREFPQKKIKIIAPPNLRHSKELVKAAGGDKRASSIKVLHLERSLFPAQIVDPTTGVVITKRPENYDPPSVA